MTTYDLRLDVPARAFINSQLLSRLESGGTLFNAKKDLFKQEPYVRQGMTPYNWRVHDTSVAVSLLFCTIVVPREILELPTDHPIYSEFDAQNVISCFTISKPASINSYKFIRCLRNSVAHALFSIRELNGQAQYEFWTDREEFRAAVGHEDLLKFISAVGKRFGNAVLALK